jgi:hypothetical protein
VSVDHSRSECPVLSSAGAPDSRQMRTSVPQLFVLPPRLRGMTTVVRLRGSSRARRIAVWLAVALVALVALLAALAARVIYVHDKTWEYRLFPSATPPKVGYHDRDYSRGSDLPRVEAGLVRSGETMGGGVIYAPTGSRTATVIDVVDGQHVVEYSLMGGP